MAPAKYSLIDANTGKVLVPKLEVASTFWRRFLGLQFRRSLAVDEGLLIVPCRCIHTHWMRFPIDVAMLDRQGNIVAIHRAVKPWRMLGGPRETHAVLEVPAGAMPDALSIGDRVSRT